MGKRALTVVQMLPDLEEGGVECETVELSGYLTGQGHRSIVISRGGRMVADLTAAGGEHLAWAHIGEKSPRCLAHLLPLRRLLVRSRVDILHLRSRLPAWVGYLAWKSLPGAKRPGLVTTFHGFYSVNAYSAIMTRGQRVIAVSRTIAGHIEAAYGLPADSMDIVYGGYDETRFDPERVGIERKTGLLGQWGVAEHHPPIILLPGRITRLKGHDLFIRSLSKIRELPWLAVCAGDTAENPKLHQELRELADSLGVADRVRFVGYCADMPAALMAARVVVSASTQPESFGRIAVEAQAMGTPVIATAHGGSLEVVLDGESGWLVTPGDEARMARAMAAAITDKDRAMRMGKAGRAWVRRQFTARKTFERTVAVYHKLLGDAASRDGKNGTRRMGEG
ncbi:MAG: glycosyltransferase family 4 protein [Thermodesulfobacteriota bacterium]